MELFDWEGEPEKPVGDFASLAASIPLVLSERAMGILRPLIGRDVEVLPLRSAAGSFSALNVLACDCLDLENSVVERFSTGRIKRIEAYSFREERIAERRIFRIPEEIMSRTFVDDVLKEAIERNALTGLIFSKA